MATQGTGLLIGAAALGAAIYLLVKRVRADDEPDGTGGGSTGTAPGSEDIFAVNPSPLIQSYRQNR